MPHNHMPPILAADPPPVIILILILILILLMSMNFGANPALLFMCQRFIYAVLHSLTAVAQKGSSLGLPC